MNTLMSKIPKLKTEKDIRDFWDTHDSSEYSDDMQDDSVIVSDNLKRNIRVKLKPVEIKKIRIIAKRQRISSSKFIKRCIEKSLKRTTV